VQSDDDRLDSQATELDPKLVNHFGTLAATIAHWTTRKECAQCALEKQQQQQYLEIAKVTRGSLPLNH